MHISVSEIKWDEKSQALQITTRIFLDDLESAVRKETHQPELDILKPGGNQNTDQLVSAYFKQHFVVALDGKQQPLNFLGSEREDLALICYVEIEHVKSFKHIQVTNNLLMDLYDDQSNLVHVIYKGPIKSMRLMVDKPSDGFTFDDK